VLKGPDTDTSAKVPTKLANALSQAADTTKRQIQQLTDAEFVAYRRYSYR